MMAPVQDEISKLRLDMVNTEKKLREAEQQVAALMGQLNDGKHADLAQLRQQLADAQAVSETAADELEKLKKKLVDAEQLAADETSRADRAALDASALRQLNLNLNSVVQVLKQTVAAPAPVAQAPPTRNDVQRFTPWYKRGKVWAVAGGVALVLLITAVSVKLISDMFGNSPASAPAPAVVVEQAKPAVPAPTTVAPSIQPTNTPKSSCPYTSLNACVDDMARRLGVAPSDTSIRKHGPYSCQRIGCQ